jgi:hypothetical protein
METIAAVVAELTCTEEDLAHESLQVLFFRGCILDFSPLS